MRKVILLAIAFPLFAGDSRSLLSWPHGWTGPGTFEMWIKQPGGSVLGAGRTIKDNKVAASPKRHVRCEETLSGGGLH